MDAAGVALTSRVSPSHPITGRTRLLAIIADPVAGTLSPLMVNTILQQRGLFGAFALMPMQVAADGLEPTVTALRHIKSFAGAIFSMPHKSAIVPLLDELTPEAGLVGAVNVVRRNADGRLLGTILDGEGFVAGLRSAGHEVTSASCLLVGAGGAAAAIAFALARHGCGSLTVKNRTASKAARLAARVQQAFPAARVLTADATLGSYDLLINASSLGMRPDDDLPVHEDVIERSGLIAECVVAPERTRLLQLADEKGRPTHAGMPMLAAQIDLMLQFMGVE